MRDILFRGMTEDREWVEGGIVHQTDYYGDEVDEWLIVDGTCTLDYGIGDYEKVLPETIGQYTGLCDKNGVKIFGGDIVVKEDKYCKMYGVISFGRHSPTTAELGEIGFYIEWVDNNSNLWSEWIRNDLGFWADGGVEVVGNIHENKELLEGR